MKNIPFTNNKLCTSAVNVGLKALGGYVLVFPVVHHAIANL
jgi:hypothetical protein